MVPCMVTFARMALNPARTVAELEELRELTGDENGAQRVAWTDTWETAREWLRGKMGETGATEQIDEAGNQWFTLAGASERALLIGGHIDSVPNGGWLDGSLNVMAGAEVLRRIAAEGRPPLTVRLVNWADEEGGPRRRARRRWTRGAMLLRARRSWHSRSGRSRPRSAAAPCAPPAASSVGRASSPRSSRRPSSCSTSATSTRSSSRACWRLSRRRA